MIRLLGRYFKENKLLVILNIVFVALQIIIQTVFLMKEMKNIIDNGVGRQDMDYIIHSGIKMIVFTLLVGACTIAASYLSAKIVAKMTCRIREDCYKKVVTL